MGQTLTHGIYLPDEGERNCYNGLAANWSILDGAVGTIAEHTSQIAGKAPASHTHTKADITDLFNSANTWSESQTYAKAINYKTSYVLGNLPGNAAGQQAFKILESTGTDFICDIASFQNTLATGLRFTTKNKMDANGFSPSGTIKAAYLHFLQNAENKGYLQWDGYTKNNVIPLTTNTYDLGSSSYQWNNLYAKNYYYNGVAWGLDKANVWTAWQTQEHATEPLIRLRRSNLQIGDPIPASQQTIGTIPFADKNNLNLGLIACRDNTNGDTYLTLIARQRYDSNGRANNGTQYESRIDLGVDSSHNLYLRPNSNGQINLGTSTNKWKTLNGINPGALSLPDISDADPISTNNWVGDNSSSNQYTPTENGWIYFRIEGANKNITIRYGGAGGDAPSITSESTISHLSVFFPVRSGVTMYIFFNGTMVKAFFYPCLGNV